MKLPAFSLSAFLAPLSGLARLAPLHRRTLSASLAGLGLFALLAGCGPATSNAGQATGISPEQAVDYIHTVIQADRTTYARQVVERLQDRDHVLRASEHFEEDKTLPLPAQMLRMGAQLASRQGSLHYALVSPWAINKANLPKTEFERQGLAAVAAGTHQRFTAYQSAGGQHYFSAIYPDLAVSSACVNCHNGHPESPRHNFREGDVMGGVVISLPVSDAP